MKRFGTFLYAAILWLAIGGYANAQNLTLGGKVRLVVASVGGDIEDALGELDSKTGFTATRSRFFSGSAPSRFAMS